MLFYQAIYHAVVLLIQKITLNNSGKQSFHWFQVLINHYKNEIFWEKRQSSIPIIIPNWWK